MNTENTTLVEPTAESAPVESLASAVVGMLSSAGHPNPSAWRRYMHATGDTGNFEQQRAAVNGAWQHILGLFSSQTGKPTFDERYCLLDRGTREDWLSNFSAGVLPCIVKNGLPQ